MKNRIAILVGLVAAIVLLFTSTSMVSAAGEGKDRNRQLNTKERLTADDVSYLKRLPREERRGGSHGARLAGDRDSRPV